MMMRAATAADELVLWEMLTYAASMSGPIEQSIATARADAYLGSYVRDFGQRAGDRGLVALVAEEDVGAAWLRLGHGEGGPHALATPTEPELAIGIRPDARGRGVGSRLLAQLIEEARFPAIVLSVRSTNPSVRLYLRHGFQTVRTVINRVGGDSLVMRRQRS